MNLKTVIYNDTNEHESIVFWVGELIDEQGKVVHRSERYTDLDELEDVIGWMKVAIEKEE